MGSAAEGICHVLCAATGRRKIGRKNKTIESLLLLLLLGCWALPCINCACTKANVGGTRKASVKWLSWRTAIQVNLLARSAEWQTQLLFTCDFIICAYWFCIHLFIFFFSKRKGVLLDWEYNCISRPITSPCLSCFHISFRDRVIYLSRTMAPYFLSASCDDVASTRSLDWLEK